MKAPGRSPPAQRAGWQQAGAGDMLDAMLSRLPVALLASVLALPSAAAPPACVEIEVASPASTHSSLAAADPVRLALEDVEWRLLAEGASLSGDLLLTFAGAEGKTEVMATLRLAVPSGLRVHAPVRLLRGDEIPWAAAKTTKPPAAGRRDARGSRAQEPAGALEVREWVAPVEPGEDILVRIPLEAEAPLASGAFHAGLPAIGARCASGAEGPLPRFTLRVAGGGVSEANSPHGTVTIDQDEPDDVLVLELDDASQGPRALVVSWILKGEDETGGRAFLRTRPDGRREISVVVTAPSRVDESLVRARDLVFVLDASGSMAKEGKLDVARRAVLAALQSLREVDAFNVLAFRDAPEPALPLPAGGDGAMERVSQFLAGLRAQGGTRLEPALSAALAQRRESQGHRVIVVLSDGIVGDEKAVLELVASAPKDARLLLVSIGSDARFEVLQRIAEAGRGEALRVADPASLGRLLEPFLASFATPVAWDLAVDWDGAEISDVRPARIPDLHAGRPVTLRAVVEGRAPGRLRIRGNTTDGDESLDLLVPVEESR